MNSPTGSSATVGSNRGSVFLARKKDEKGLTNQTRTRLSPSYRRVQDIAHDGHLRSHSRRDRHERPLRQHGGRHHRARRLPGKQTAHHCRPSQHFFLRSSLGFHETTALLFLRSGSPRRTGGLTCPWEGGLMRKGKRERKRTLGRTQGEIGSRRRKRER